MLRDPDDQRLGHYLAEQDITSSGGTIFAPVAATCRSMAAIKGPLYMTRLSSPTRSS